MKDATLIMKVVVFRDILVVQQIVKKKNVIRSGYYKVMKYAFIMKTQKNAFFTIKNAQNIKELTNIYV